MGKMIEQIALSRGHEIVSVIDIDNQQDFDSDAFASADVAVEFTSPTAAYGNYLKAFAKNVKVVSGSTGWMKDHADDVKRLCTEGGQTLFWASNFSIGVAIFSLRNDGYITTASALAAIAILLIVILNSIVNAILKDRKKG